MSNLVLQAEALNLPEYYARKLRGKKVELIENGDTIVITPINDVILHARGILRGGSFTTQRFTELKSAEKELEDA
jgi:virulence-associated protein VagC